MKVFITRKIPTVAKEILEKSGFSVNVFPHDRIITREELVKNAKDADGIIALLTEKYDKEMIDQLPNCKIIANYAVGFNNIDIEYAKSKNIIVTNTPDVLTDATAEVAAALVISCARRVPEAENLMRENKFKGWEPELLIGVQLTGKTIGIIGAGRIGQATAKRIKGFGCKVIYYNRTKKAEFEKDLSAQKVSLYKLMKTADIISIHLPLNTSTNKLLDKEKLELMKPNAIIVNTARGEIVDEKYLIKMLKSKRIFSAGFDVYENEPNVNPDLLKLKNVVIFPHIGSGTIETRNAMAELAAKNVNNVLKGKKPLTSVF
jgi:glyoxylate reductase